MVNWNPKKEFSKIIIDLKEGETQIKITIRTNDPLHKINLIDPVLSVARVGISRKSTLYRTGQYGRYIPYRSLKRYKNTCVSFQFKHRSKRVVPAIPNEISCFGRKNHTGLKHDFQIKRKEKFSDPISLPSFSNILTYSLSLCCCRR